MNLRSPVFWLIVGLASFLVLLELLRGDRTRRSAIADFIVRLYQEMLCDSTDGRFSIKKGGELTVGVTWTTYMWRAQPGSVEMWIAYATVLLTWSTANLALKKFGPQAEASP